MSSDRLLVQLGRVASVLKERERVYGDAHETHERIAKMWSAYLGVDVGAVDVVRMLTLLKLARAAKSDVVDNDVDGIGYLTIALSLQDGDGS